MTNNRDEEAESSRSLGRIEAEFDSPVSDQQKKRDYWNAWYQKNKHKESPKRAKRSKERRQEHKEFLWDYLVKNPCVNCVNNDPRVLEFHHLRDKKFNVSEPQGRALETLVKEIEKCCVLCANCHRVRTYEELGYWTPK